MERHNECCKCEKSPTQDSSLIKLGKVTLDRALLNAVNVRKSSTQDTYSLDITNFTREKTAYMYRNIHIPCSVYQPLRSLLMVLSAWTEPHTSQHLQKFQVCRSCVAFFHLLRDLARLSLTVSIEGFSPLPGKYPVFITPTSQHVKGRKPQCATIHRRCEKSEHSFISHLTLWCVWPMIHF